MSILKRRSKAGVDRRSGGERWALRAAITLTAIVVVILGANLALFFPPLWPQLEIDQPSDLITDEFTSDGYPVVRVGAPIEYTTSLCNDGVDVTSVRFFGSHDTPLSAPDLLPPTEEAGTTIFMSEEEIEVDQSFCREDIPVSVDVRGSFDEGYWSLITENSYNANFAMRRTERTQTEIFYLLPVGAEIP